MDETDLLIDVADSINRNLLGFKVFGDDCVAPSHAVQAAQLVYIFGWQGPLRLANTKLRPQFCWLLQYCAS